MSMTICPQCKAMFDNWPNPNCPHCSAHTRESHLVHKKEPGLWHQLKSAFSPNTDVCPQCHENLAGEQVDTSLIDRQEGYETKYQYEQQFGSSHVTRRLAQVVVYHDLYWQFFRCKFCGHEWKEKHRNTWQP